MICIDLFCGLGGWTEGFLAEGYSVIGFDIEHKDYPGQLVIQDVLTLHGAQFRDVALIVASPPCTEYSEAKTTKPRDLVRTDKLVRRTRELIEWLQSRMWCIKNRRWGLLHRGKPFKELL